MLHVEWPGPFVSLQTIFIKYPILYHYSYLCKSGKDHQAYPKINKHKAIPSHSKTSQSPLKKATSNPIPSKNKFHSRDNISDKMSSNWLRICWAKFLSEPLKTEPCEPLLLKPKPTKPPQTKHAMPTTVARILNRQKNRKNKIFLA